MLYYTIFLLSAGCLVYAATNCPSNSVCFSPVEAANITVTCDNVENYLSLKWKTTQKRSELQFYNGMNLLTFTCGFPIGSSNLDMKIYKIEYIKSENITSCQVDFYHSAVVDPNVVSFLKWNDKKSDDFRFHDVCNPPAAEGLSKNVKRTLVKLHAILMIIGWLFFVPTGFLFARFGKTAFNEQKLLGMPVWFQVHRCSTFVGVCCICSSILCIFISTNWSWKGTGSDAWYWTQWHTDLGTISTILAVSQPLNSLLRCPPSNSQRSIFNWFHRIIGLMSYTFAVAAIYVAAANYRKTWSEPTMEIVLTSVPSVLCLTTAFLHSYWEGKKNNGYKEVEVNDKTSSIVSKQERVQLQQISWMFSVVGICFGVASALSLLVANGFKAK